jgi:tRNA(fMet)-specific endonuclease VapC
MEAGFADLQEIPFDGRAALEAARIRIELEREGMRIGPMDILIAGTVISRGDSLATNNVREFSRVRELKLIDWRSPE